MAIFNNVALDILTPWADEPFYLEVIKHDRVLKPAVDAITKETKKLALDKYIELAYSPVSFQTGENFEAYFKRFLKELLQVHPDLTPGELLLFLAMKFPKSFKDRMVYAWKELGFTPASISAVEIRLMSRAEDFDSIYTSGSRPNKNTSNANNGNQKSKKGKQNDKSQDNSKFKQNNQKKSKTESTE